MAKAKSSSWCSCGAKTHKKHNIGCPRRKNSGGLTVGQPVTQVAVPVKQAQAKAKAPVQPTRVIGSTNQKHVVYILVDTSASMAPYNSLPQKFVNEQIEAFTSSGQTLGIETVVNVVEFDSSPNLVKLGPNGKYSGYRADGHSTAIFSAIQFIVNIAKDGCPHTLLVITDGENNAGLSGADGQRMLTALNNTGRWTTAFLGPSGCAYQLRALGVVADNIRVWDLTSADLQVATADTVRSVKGHMLGVSRGVTSNNKFYAKVDNARSVTALPIASGLLQSLVTTKQSIEDHVNHVLKPTGKKYIPGVAYYELTKPVKIHSYKKLFLQDRNTGEIKGALDPSTQEAVRHAVGIPVGVDAQVEPSDLKGYTVYVESTSYNRALVPGTRVLIKQ